MAHSETFLNEALTDARAVVYAETRVDAISVFSSATGLKGEWRIRCSDCHCQIDYCVVENAADPYGYLLWRLREFAAFVNPELYEVARNRWSEKPYVSRGNCAVCHIGSYQHGRCDYCGSYPPAGGLLPGHPRP